MFSHSDITQAEERMYGSPWSGGNPLRMATPSWLRMWISAGRLWSNSELDSSFQRVRRSH